MVLLERSGEYGFEFASRRAILADESLIFGLPQVSMLAMQVDRVAIVRKMHALLARLLGVQVMVLLEMSIVPMGVGESVSQYVAECVDLVDQSGLDYEVHSMGTIVEGELDEVLDTDEEVYREVGRAFRPCDLQREIGLSPRNERTAHGQGR